LYNNSKTNVKKSRYLDLNNRKERALNASNY